MKILKSGYPSSGQTVFTSARRWGCVVIFRNQKGSACTNIWKAPLLRVFGSEDCETSLEYVEVNKLLYFWVCYMCIYLFYKSRKPVKNLLNRCIGADCTSLLNRFTWKIPKCLIRTERLLLIKTKHYSAINTHYNLHTYIQHHETSERRNKILKTFFIFSWHKPLISRSDPS